MNHESFSAKLILNRPITGLDSPTDQSLVLHARVSGYKYSYLGIKQTFKQAPRELQDISGHGDFDS